MLRLETSEDRGTARRLSSLAENVICIGITRMSQTGIALGISLFARRPPRHSNRASLDPDLLRGNANTAIAFAYKFAMEVGPIRSAVGPGAHAQPLHYTGHVECLVISRADKRQARLDWPLAGHCQTTQ